MATQIITRWIDDLDGSSDAETRYFGLGGTNYKIDLTDENAAKLAEALAPFIAKAERVKDYPRKATSSPAKVVPNKVAATVDKAQRDGQRAFWQTANSRKVLGLPKYYTRGRIPAAVVKAYEEHGGIVPEVPAKVTPTKATRPAALKTLPHSARGKKTTPAPPDGKGFKTVKAVPAAQFQPADSAAKV